MKTEFKPGRRPFRWTTTHSAFMFSTAFHVVLLLIVALLYPGLVKDAAETLHFQIVMVSAGSIEQQSSAEDKEASREEQGGSASLPAPSATETSEEKTSPPPLPGFAYPTQAPSPREVQFDVTVNDEKTAPQEAPALPVISSSYQVTPLRRPGALETPAENGSGTDGKGDMTAVDIYGTGGSGTGTGAGTGTGSGRKKVAAMAMDGCKLYILPPNEQPLTKEKALSLCEGITPHEEKQAVSIEMKVALREDGQPSDIQLTHSSGDKKLDSAVENLMPLMRFEVKGASNCYLTLIIICGDEGDKGSSRTSNHSASQ
ncbi:MAG: energy transducer TonB [Candidatus Xenobiia bacterium LiM19]